MEKIEIMRKNAKYAVAKYIQKTKYRSEPEGSWQNRLRKVKLFYEAYAYISGAKTAEEELTKNDVSCLK